MRGAALPVMLAGLALLSGCAAPPPPALTAIAAEELRADPGLVPDSGYLVTGQPDAGTLRAIAAAGYVGIVDLRTPTEDRGFDEAGLASDLGLQYVSLPIAGGADVTYDKAAALDEILARFDGPLLLHCSSGNRVGALFALRARTAGASEEDALATGLAAGLTSLEPIVRQRLEETR